MRKGVRGGKKRGDRQVDDEGVGDLGEGTSLRVEVLDLAEADDGRLLEDLHRKVVRLGLRRSSRRQAQAREQHFPERPRPCSPIQSALAPSPPPPQKRRRKRKAHPAYRACQSPPTRSPSPPPSSSRPPTPSASPPSQSYPPSRPATPFPTLSPFPCFLLPNLPAAVPPPAAAAADSQRAASRRAHSSARRDARGKRARTGVGGVRRGVLRAPGG